MRQKKWRGTLLFAVIFLVMALTVGLRLYAGGHVGPATAQSASTGTSPASTPSPSPSASASASPATPAPSPSATTAATTRTINGAQEQTPYGPIQVAVTFVGSKITGVNVLESPNDRGRSVEINSYATPILGQEVMSAQSARIDTVSGATYTSNGYAQSVQSAIDQR